jgi:serine phosphatase RsbU (regulator of sigma subunit)/streptogramin lyase
MGNWGKHFWRYKDGKVIQYETGTPTTAFDEGVDGSIWVATWEKGLLKFVGDSTFIQYGEDEGMTMNTMWDVTVDAEGCVWGATYGAGVNQLVGERFSIIDKQVGLSNDIVNDVKIDSSSNIWVATEGGITLIRPDGSFEIFDDEDGIVSGKAMSLLVDSNNHVWSTFYAGGKGVVEFADEKIVNFYSQGGFSVNQDSRGNYWFGTDGDGVHRLHGQDGEMKYSPKYLNKPRGYNFYEDLEGRIWMAIDHNAWHVYHPDENVFYDSLFPPHLRPIAGATMCQDYTGNYWIALERKAVYRCSYEAGELKILDTLDKSRGLPSNAVWGFLPEDDFMWIHTQAGLSKMDLKTYYENNEILIKNYTVKQGYLGDGASPITRKNEHELLIGSSKGLLTFHENNDRPVSAPPYTNITEVKLNQKETKWTEYQAKLKPNSNVPNSVELAYDQNYLTFTFVGISFSAPEEVRYSYMLEGFDQTWSPITGQREITYSNIAPGEYVFKVKSVNLDGMWDESPEEIKITIAPPFWQTWWFRILLVFGIALVVWIIFQWRLQKLQKDKKKLEDKVEERTAELQVAYDQIEEKNHEITDSISYAKRIQFAILPPPSFFKEQMGESFVLYQPKDIVAGDFYWLNKWGDKVLFAAADCTGHGVPGAMVSVVCHGALNRSVREFDLGEPAKILDKTREIVIETFEKSEEDVKDGMDIALCALDRKKGVLEFSGANNSLYIIKKGELEEVKADKQPIGKYEFAQPFVNNEIKVEKGTIIYLFSDGFADQFGGEKGKKLKYKPFKEILLSICDKPMVEQKAILQQKFDDWKGEFEQVDDVCIIGVRL